jgi:hypothetical protein
MKQTLAGLLALMTLLCGTGETQAGPVLGGLVNWFEANVGVTVDPSGHVSGWADQSGMGHDASQASGSSQPLLINNALNGEPVLSFDGSGQFLNIAGQPLTSQQFTIIALVTNTRNGSDSGFQEVYSNWSSTTFERSVFLGTTGQNPVRARFTDDMGGATDPNHNQQGVGTVSNPAAPFIFTGLSGASDAAIYQNSNLIADNGGPLSTRDLSAADGTYRIGTQGGGMEFWQGDIAEILVYNAALSSSELQQDWTYLDQKYFAAAVPEPSALTLLCFGMAGIVYKICSHL